MTQVIITESDNRASSVGIKPTASTKDVVKTYFVTYTYFNTVLEGESTVIKSAVATSSDVVTEKFVVPPKRTSLNTEKSEKIVATKAPEVDSDENAINVLATKTYLTTFTYFTTLLQDNSGVPSTVVKSSTNVVQNIVTETLDTELFDSEYLNSLRSSLQTDGLPIVATATLNNGQQMEITAMSEQIVKQTELPSNEISSSFEESSSNNVITGSTIIFFDENDQIDNTAPSTTKTLAIEVAGHTKLPVAIDSDDSKAESLSSAESQALTVTAEDSETEEAQNLYVTSILASRTVTRNGNTLLPGAQVIKFRDPNGNVSVIPVSDPVKSHLNGTHATGSSATVNNFLNLGSIGINSLNALGPVINAMAGLIKSNLKTEHRRKNDTVGITANEPTDVSFKRNPLLTYSGPKPPARSPIYIPVGGLAADSVAEESQSLEGHNLFVDVTQRNKQSVILGKPTMESPLLAGGIPISPGQVITANSDVIIGRPSIHGVRPPVAPPPSVPHPAPPPQPHQHHSDFGKPYRKDDIPLGMRPPPMPKKPQKWPQRDHNGQYIPLVHHQNRESPNRNPLPGRDSPYLAVVQNYDTINYNPEFYKNEYHTKRHPVNHNYPPPTRKEESIQPPNRPYMSQQNIQTYNNIPNNLDTRPPHSNTEGLNLVSTNVDYVNHHQAHISLPDNTNFVDQSAINPLLVNLQPSQVANVIIPHGSSTALIYSGEHSQKGEIFNDPSPYPDAKVEHVVDALSTARPPPEGEGITHAARVPIHTNNLDVPVSPHGINVAAGNQPVYQNQHQHPQIYLKENQRRPEVYHHQVYQQQDHRRHPSVQNNQHYKFEKPLANDASLGEFLQPPPPTQAEEDEFIFGDKTNEQEGGEVTQESNARPLLLGQLPTQLTPNPSTSMPIDPLDDERRGNGNLQFNQRPKRPARPDLDINFSVVNSKPVQLDGLSNINNQAPIITGRPELPANQFKDKSQATLAIGTPTKLKPDEPVVYTHKDHTSGNSFVNPALFAAISHEIVHEDQPKPVKWPVQHDNQKLHNHHQPKPVRDQTVHTMNLDEKLPPPPRFEKPSSHNTPSVDLDSQPSTSRPVNVLNPGQHEFDINSQKDDSVMGLFPPPPDRYPIQDETLSQPILPMGHPQRRPVLPPRKPKPPPPYAFEIPPPTINQEPPRPTLPPKMEPPPPPLPTLPDTLSPPRAEEDYFHKIPVKKPVNSDHHYNLQTGSKPEVITQAEILNPVLQGVLTVEERPQQPEVITADSKVLTNIIKGHRPKPEIGIKITGSQPAMQTVVVGKPVSVPVTNVVPDSLKPTSVENLKPTKLWEDIIGSEPPPVVDSHEHFATPVASAKHTSTTSKQEPSVLVTSGVTTIFGKYFTQPTEHSKIIKPTKSVGNHHSVVSVVVEPKENKTEINYDESKKKGQHKVVLMVEDQDGALDTFNDIITSPPPTTFVVTHTQTTTVTSVQTTVINSKGKLPSTHTLVLTKTKISTLLDTITEVHTLVTQTSILSTITKTVPHIVSTIYTSPVTPEEILVQGEIETTKRPEKNEPKPPALNPHDNESILLVVTDKKSGSIPIIQDNQSPPEIQVDENNEILPNEIQKGSVFSTITSSSECKPECKASRNELCQKIDNQMRCVCRPGFARMFPDRPCKRKCLILFPLRLNLI